VERWRCYSPRAIEAGDPAHNGHSVGAGVVAGQIRVALAEVMRASQVDRPGQGELRTAYHKRAPARNARTGVIAEGSARKIYGCSGRHGYGAGVGAAAKQAQGPGLHVHHAEIVQAEVKVVRAGSHGAQGAGIVKARWRATVVKD